MLEPNDVLNELQELRDNGFLADALLRRAVKDIAAADDRFDWVGIYLLNSEENMVWLATMVTVAPFMGLLGTVWGVMESFSAVSVMQTASIQTLAPGVSAALLTTIAGLVVAIPSVVGYNVLLNKTKVLSTEIENYASTLADRIELEMTK